MKTVKTVKRRIVQKTIELAGHKSENVRLDEADFKMAVENFKRMEDEIKNVLNEVKNARAASVKYVEKNAALGASLSTFFSSDNTDLSLRPASSDVATILAKANASIQRSCGKVLQDNVVDPMLQLCNERFPAIKKKIVQHGNFEVDLSSYARRVKNLQEKGGKPEEIAKFKEKLDRTMEQYKTFHRDLLMELKTLYNDRFNSLRRAFITILATQFELQNQVTLEIGKILQQIDRGDVQSVKQNLGDLIKQGGPPENSLTDDLPASSKLGLVTNPKLKSLISTVGGSFANRVRGSSTTERVSDASVTKGSSPNNSSRALNSNGDSSPSPAQQPLELEVECEEFLALYDYAGQDEGDLSFSAGDTIYVQEKIDEGWWRGSKEDGVFGLFPSNYVSPVTE